MGAVFGAAIDLCHALLMAAWVIGLPLLFFHRWPRLTHVYAIYAIGFIAINQLSDAVLGECFLTTFARAAWENGTSAGQSTVSHEWFTVRLADAIFRLTPSHRAIKLVSQALVLVTAAGVAYRGMMRHRPKTPGPIASAGPRA